MWPPHCASLVSLHITLFRAMPNALRVLLVIALLFSAACSQVPPPARLAEGSAFPALQLPRFDGGFTPIAEYRGKVVVLNVWATWCPPCRAELPSLDRLAARLDASRFAVIGLSVDSEIDIAQEFLEERGVRFTSYIDADQKISQDILEIRAYPVTFIIGPQGQLWRRILGERAWDDPQIVSALERAYEGGPAALTRL